MKSSPTDVTTTTDPSWLPNQIVATSDSRSLLHHEWLLTNGTGAFSMGTAAAVNTRRYHGLLVAATHPPVSRVLALNQTIERLILKRTDAQQPIEFSSCLFRSGDDDQLLSPPGYTLLRQFQKGLCARWTYSWGKLQFTRELRLHWKEQVATLAYTLRGLSSADAGAQLQIGPLVTLRDFHSALHADRTPPFNLHFTADTITASRDNLQLTLHCPGATIHRTKEWWYNLHYPLETERGLDDREDAFLPGYFEIDLPKTDEFTVSLTAALGSRAAGPIDLSLDRIAHLDTILTHIASGTEVNNPLMRALAVAADDFVVDRQFGEHKLSTIIAGYPWFADWGRDTFIALPGLLLSTGRFDEARDTLRAFARFIRNGLVPNRFDDYNEDAAHYNTVDASLWFIHAAVQYLHTSQDQTSWNDWLRDACLQIVDAYIKGTDFDIRMAGDGLITAGSPETQLTWMDAKCNDVIFTARDGKTVEINALWYSALCSLAPLLGNSDASTANHFNKLTKRITRAFLKVFWDDELGYLRDRVWIDVDGQTHNDDTLRPNQIFTLSLPHSPVPRTKQQKVLDTLRKRLLTPFGLRTLPEDDPQYHPHYHGDPFHRDEAYHQGTVWPWLMGPYAEGVLRLGRFSEESRQEARRLIDPLLEHLMGPGLGQLSEIHEADPPHRPVGCPAQAWSVAELLRVYTLIQHPPTV